jgi:tryptophan synthase alpha chain
MVLFGYYNPILVGGEARVVASAADAGVDALLVVDLPPEEATPLRALASARGLALVPLVAPTTDDARASAITEALRRTDAARGFVYYVSMTGVTGAASPDLVRAAGEAAALRGRLALPVVVGFGIDGPDAARAAAGPAGGGADGIVVGSALVRRIESSPTRAERLAAVTSIVRSLRTALDDANVR